MKLILIISITLLSCSITEIAYGQDGERLEDMYLKGKYVASCAMEVVDHATISNCELCTFVIDSSDKSRGSLSDIEMTFGADSLSLNQTGKNISIPYTRDKNNHSFSFTLNNKSYHFRVFYYDKFNLIEDDDGMIMVLTKVN